MQPKILLIDEALAVGDRAFRRRSATRIEELLAATGTLMLVSHSLPEIAKQCDRVLWIEQGELRADGDPDAIIEEYTEFVA